MGLLAGDDVLIRVVDVVVGDGDRDVFVPHQQHHALEVEVVNQIGEVRCAHGRSAQPFCFSLQVMQTRVQGMAFRRASAMGSPQSLQTPNEPFSIRISASSIACRILASVCFSRSWMWTSLFPAAWSAMSPCRPLLCSIESVSGLKPAVSSSSARFFSKASLKTETFM